MCGKKNSIVADALSVGCCASMSGDVIEVFDESKKVYLLFCTGAGKRVVVFASKQNLSLLH